MVRLENKIYLTRAFVFGESPQTRQGLGEILMRQEGKHARNSQTMHLLRLLIHVTEQVQVTHRQRVVVPFKSGQLGGLVLRN